MQLVVYYELIFFLEVLDSKFGQCVSSLFLFRFFISDLEGWEGVFEFFRTSLEPLQLFFCLMTCLEKFDKQTKIDCA